MSNSVKVDPNTIGQGKHKGKHALVGSGLHFKRPDGYVMHQAAVMEVVASNSIQGDMVLIQYFSWFMGDPTTRRLIPMTELTSEQWVWYESVADMNEHWERVDSHSNERIDSKPKKEAA